MLNAGATKERDEGRSGRIDSAYANLYSLHNATAVAEGNGTFWAIGAFLTSPVSTGAVLSRQSGGASRSYVDSLSIVRA